MLLRSVPVVDVPTARLATKGCDMVGGTRRRVATVLLAATAAAGCGDGDGAMGFSGFISDPTPAAAAPETDLAGA